MPHPKNKELDRKNLPLNKNDSSPPLSVNHNYVNLDDAREDMERSGNKPYAHPLTANNLNKMKTPNYNHNNSRQPGASDEKKWYSPPSSVQSDSRPPSIVGGKHQTRKDKPKMQTIDEDALALSMEKIFDLCTHENGDIQLNALGYLQHIIYNNTEKKLELRNNNGLRVIIELTRSPKTAVANGALGVLKNMSFTDMAMITNDIERLGGIQRMVSIIKSTKIDSQKEFAIDILWNLSVHYDLKTFIMSECVDTLLKYIILPESKLIKDKSGCHVTVNENINWSIILRNALGIIRNISYESTETRIKLRQEDGLIDCILHLIIMSNKVQESEGEIEQISLIDSKIVENCVCILRNLTYAIQEVLDPTYLESRNKGLQKSSEPKGLLQNKSNKQRVISPPRTEYPKGVEILWNSKYVVSALFPILKFGANAVTLEAAAGIIQNLSAGDWEPSKDLQIQFRLQLALPTLVELIDIAPDEVIRSSGTALRNLVREEYTCMLVGTNGLRIITEKIPLHSRSKKINAIALAAILSTIYAIIKNQEEFMKEFILAKGAERCIYVRDSDEFINNDDQNPDKVKQFSIFILKLLWKTSSARNLLKKNNYTQTDIIQSKTLDPCNSCLSSQSGKSKKTNEGSKVKSHSIDDNYNEFPQKYQDDNKYTRDSICTIISNPALQQRNSKAFKMNNVPGYGQVKTPLNSQNNWNDTHDDRYVNQNDRNGHTPYIYEDYNSPNSRNYEANEYVTKPRKANSNNSGNKSDKKADSWV